VGDVQRFAAKPGQSSGNYSRHLKRLLGFERERRCQYTLTIPGRMMHGLSRTPVHIPVQPIHELLQEELRESPELADELRLAVAKKALPPAYYQHPLVRENPDKLVFPCSLYLDGVPHSLVDSVVGVWATNIQSLRSH